MKRRQRGTNHYKTYCGKCKDSIALTKAAYEKLFEAESVSCNACGVPLKIIRRTTTTIYKER